MQRKRTPFVVLLAVLCVTSAEAATLLSEGFESVGDLPSAGWVLTNNSVPIGLTGWFQGNPAVFEAQAGAPEEYIAANFENADTGGGDISNWLITPTLSIANGDVLSFYTRSADGQFPDRLELRLSTNGASADVGTTATSVGDFTTTLLTVNPSLAIGGYPADWTLFEIMISGLGSPTTGRYALRYFVTNTLINANYIGIDSLVIQSVPEPSTSAMIAVLALGLLCPSRQRRG